MKNQIHPPHGAINRLSVFYVADNEFYPVVIVLVPHIKFRLLVTVKNYYLPGIKFKQSIRGDMAERSGTAGYKYHLAFDILAIPQKLFGIFFQDIACLAGDDAHDFPGNVIILVAVRYFKFIAAFELVGYNVDCLQYRVLVQTR